MAEPINLQLHGLQPDGSIQPTNAIGQDVVSSPFVFDPANRTLHWGASDEVHHSDLWPHMTTEHPWAGPIGYDGFVSHDTPSVQFYDSRMPDEDKVSVMQAMAPHLGRQPVDMDTLPDQEDEEPGLWTVANTIDEAPHHTNPYTGLPCNCHWGKPKRLKWRTASQNVRKIRNENRKIFRDEHGQNFLQRLEEMSDSYELEPMVDWFASQYKKGQMNIEPSTWSRGGHTINYLNDWGTWHPVDGVVPEWKQWMDARQHPLRRGVNIMEKTPAEVHELSKQLQTDLEEKEKRDNWARYHSDNGTHRHTFEPSQAENEFEKDLLERYNGWQVHQLENRDHCEAETAALGHCIGSDEQGYKENIHQGNNLAWSLRDRNGYPKVTWHHNQDGSLAHVQGKSGYPDEDRRHLISLFNEKYGHDDDEGGEGQEHEMEPQEDAEYQLPDPSHYDDYLAQYHPESSGWDVAQDDYEANIGENTDLLYGNPDWSGIFDSLVNADDDAQHNTIHTILNQGHEPGFQQEINERMNSQGWRENPDLYEDEARLIDRWDHAHDRAKALGKPDSPNTWERMGRPEVTYGTGAWGHNKPWHYNIPTPTPENEYATTPLPAEPPQEAYFETKAQERENARLYQDRLNPEHEMYDPILHQQVRPSPGQNPLFTENRNPYDADPETNVMGWQIPGAGGRYRVDPGLAPRGVFSNILDPVQDILPPELWDDPGSDTPRLKPVHRKWIMSEVMNVAQKFHDHPEQWCQLILTGSLTTYQYSEASDCDVSVFVDPHFLPEWDRAKLIGLAIDNIDGTVLPGTPFQMQCFIVAKNIAMSDLYQPGLRSGYDIIQNKWLVPPDKTRTHDVQREYNANWVYALESADKMERLLRYEPPKAVDFWHQIHKRRMRDQKAGKGDFSQANIVYKFLAHRGLFPSISQASGEYIAALTSGSRPGTLVANE